jgi:hypothetical protein
MTVNPWVSNLADQPEGDLIDQLCIESIQFNGFDVLYVPREILNLDYLYKEDMLSRFKDAYNIEMYMNTADSGGSDSGDILSKFGLQLKTNTEFVVSRTRFKEEIPLPRPREGDLIYSPLTAILFEITYVEHEKPYYAFGKLPVYVLSTQEFQYTSEDMTTGYSEIDQIKQLYKNDLTVPTGDAMTDTFASNEPLKTEGEIVVSDIDANNPFGGC